ncbi:hypothetical protein FOZ63_001165 [Perkinsus olseni]|uniref:Uncharacterized protein n=1 Tax=Perkinsus olseni TaxID=32597 RepID=A0A7J6R1B7_PEROL|nr:hypothetical protein FOZ60_016023 [Perkinsus olseni]KAF4713410.1 hypothetical protein FOZ63_001165 [Perkinsus olseni]KAF4744260.1 hypothetical protein FOZ62_031066 [Perkinsus olseni]
MIAAGTTRASVASFEASRNEKNDTGISCRHRELIRWGLIDGTNTPVTIEENSSLLFDEVVSIVPWAELNLLHALLNSL